MPFHSNTQKLIDKQHWARESAGYKMTNKVPAVTPAYTLADTYSFISKTIRQFDTIDYIYVVDADKKLRGVFSIKDLFRLPRGTKVEKIYKKSPLVTVLPTTDQEEVAHLSLKHDIKAVPVVDKDKIFLGVVPHYAVTSILYQELCEDILHLTGIHHSHIAFDNIFKISLFQAIKHRIPWLLVGLLGGLLAASIIGSFENILKKNLVLAAFIPLVVYIADAVGAQLEAFAIRDFALFKKLNFIQYFLKQFMVVFTIALLLGSILTLISFGIYREIKLSIVLGSAIIGAILSALASGLFVPFLFRKLKFDPANASGPIGTIIQDILSVLIYFLVASWLL
jgi:magnesium transporter